MGDVETGNGASNVAVKDFFAKVTEIRGDINNIKGGTRQIHECIQSFVSCADGDTEAQLRAKVQQLTKSTSQLASVTKGKLMAMKTETDNVAKDESQADHAQIRKNMHTLLTRKLLEVLREYESAQTEYKNTFRDKIKRQVRLVQPDASDDQIESILTTGDPRSVFRAAIVQANPALVNASRDAHEKNLEYVKIVRQMQELLKMTLDLAELVEEQGQMIDQIHMNVQRANANMERGEVHLQKAIQHAKSTRRHTCCLLFVAIIVLVVISGAGSAIAASV